MILCQTCHTPDWWRCSPGQAADATPLTPDQRQGVLLFPSGDPEVPAVAFCMACDPWLRGRAVVNETKGLSQ